MPEQQPGSPATATRPVAILLCIYAVFWLQFWIVRPTNFGGVDEWMILSLVSRGSVDIPYANRPLGLLFNLPVALSGGHLLEASLLLHGHYLVAAGLLTALLLRRVLPGHPQLALLAGLLAATWAPSDLLRLNVIYSTAYAGATAGTALVFLLLARPSVARLSLAAGLAFVVARVHEAPIPLLLLAPALLRGLGVSFTWRSLAGYWAATGLSAVVAGLPLVLGRAPTWYQSQVQGLYTDPVGLALRLLDQFRMHLEPLATASAAALTQPIAVATGGLAAAALLSARGARDLDARRLGALAGVGAAGAAAAYSTFLLAARLEGALRTEFLAAPFVGLLLTASIAALAGLVPPPARRATLALLGGLVVAAAGARTRQLQATWEAIGSYPRQAGALTQIVRLAPSLAPDTLVLFLDDGPGTWVSGFPFHHGLDLAYGRHVAGCVPAAPEPLFYACAATPRGFHFVPWRILESAWGERPRSFSHEQVVVFRSAADRRIALLEEWPSELGVLPPGARYHPRARISSLAAAPASRRVLPDP